MRSTQLNLDGNRKCQLIEELTVKCLVKTRLPTRQFGPFSVYLYENSIDDKQHLAIVFGKSINSSSLQEEILNETIHDRVVRGAAIIDTDAETSSILSLFDVDNYEETKNGLIEQCHHEVLARVHSSCFTGETLCSSRCDCAKDQLRDSMSLISSRGSGVVIYLHQEGRDIGLLDKLKAYNLQDIGHDTVTANLMLNHEADSRTYNVAVKILQDLNIHSVKLLTNNPDKIDKLESGGIKVCERVPLLPRHWTTIGASVGEKVSNQVHEPGFDGKEGHEMDAAALHPAAIWSYPTPTASTNGYHSCSVNMHRELDAYLMTKIEKMNHLGTSP